MSAGLSLLVVDDDPRIRTALLDGLTVAGHRVACVASGKDALARLRTESFDVVLLDLKMPEMDGLEVLRILRDEPVETDVVVLTGTAEVESAVAAMKLGARDLLQKPFSLAELERVVRHVRATRPAPEPELAATDTATRRVPDRRPGDTSWLVGADPRMVALRATIERVAPTDATVLITGESGTGKELVAQLLHAQSRRADGPLVAVDCPSIPPPLFESELFGHERGAFTGAIKKKRGKLEDAHGGTLFLDEVAELPLELQPKLLRFLQEREVIPIGGNRGATVDTRVIGATNTDLTIMVDHRTFRRDLFHRLAVVQIDLPPLRERTADIPLLVATFAARVAQEMGGGSKSVSADALALFAAYPWPGNVRELENVVEEGCILEGGVVITASSLSPATRRRLSTATRSDAVAPEAGDREHIVEVLERERWNISRAARTLGIHRATLHRKILSLGLRRL